MLRKLTWTSPLTPGSTCESVGQWQVSWGPGCCSTAEWGMSVQGLLQKAELSHHAEENTHNERLISSVCFWLYFAIQTDKVVLLTMSTHVRMLLKLLSLSFFSSLCRLLTVSLWENAGTVCVSGVCVYVCAWVCEDVCVWCLCGVCDVCVVCVYVCVCTRVCEDVCMVCGVCDVCVLITMYS